MNTFHNILLIKLVNYFEPSIIIRYNNGDIYMYVKYTLDRFHVTCYTKVPYRPTSTV